MRLDLSFKLIFLLFVDVIHIDAFSAHVTFPEVLVDRKTLYWKLFIVEGMRRLTSIVSHLATEMCDTEQGLYPLIIHLESENNKTH